MVVVSSNSTARLKAVRHNGGRQALYYITKEALMVTDRVTQFPAGHRSTVTRR